ncbi:MAG: hypothetical protein Q8920_16955, partial [Bacillota bacterium]|nr:hypothetical protein [Bacillota bacterium]
MNPAKFKGTGCIGGGEYKTVSFEGVYDCTGDVKAENISIDGVFKCSGTVEVGLLHCNGVSDFKSDIKAENLEVEGVLSGNKIEATEIHCKGAISVDGEISADLVDAEGFISAKEIVGDRIIIQSRTHKFILIVGKWKLSRVDMIEATTVDLKGVTAKSVSGRDIRIGENCVIENVDC